MNVQLWGIYTEHIQIFIEFVLKKSLALFNEDVLRFIKSDSKDIYNDTKGFYFK